MTEATASKYTAADIQVLEGLEAVRRRPGMYIGSTDERGLHHLVYEIVDNSIDEAMAGFCDRIDIVIMADGSVRVTDNGRGIPIDTHQRTGKSALETVMTYLHAGGKFDSQAYKVSGGLHGVGAAVVNALSSHMWVEVTRGGKVYRQDYERGKAKGELKASSNGAVHTGTTTWFMPDADIFGETEFSFPTLAERFREMAFLTKGIWIHFVDERSGQRITYYFEGGIKSFVRRLNKDRGTVHEPFYMERGVEGSIVEVAIQYNDSFNESTFAFANCIHTIDGGTHLTGFRSALTRVLNDYARRQKILKDNDPNLSGEDTREGLVAVVSVKLPEPQFEGQTKTRLGNAEMKGIVESALGEELSTWLGAPLGRAAHYREVPHRGAGPRGRPQGARPRHQERLHGRQRPPRQAGRLLRAQSRSPRAISRRRSVGWRQRQGRARPSLPGDPAAAGQEIERGEGASGQGAGPRGDKGDHHSARRRLRRRPGSRKAARPARDHHDGCRRGRRAHPYASADLLLPLHARPDRAGPSLHRPAAALSRAEPPGGAVVLLR